MSHVGMPAALHLDEFAAHVFGAFGEDCFLVGSAMTAKVWRDVDVRLILPDDEYQRLGLGDPDRPHTNAKWVALVMAFSALGRQMTGLPIDFQIQQMTKANKEHPSEPRSALGCVHWRYR